MDASPYYAPTYFPDAYFYDVPVSQSGSTPPGPLPYNAPTYFAPAYFYGPSSKATVPTVVRPYNAPTYFAPAYFYGPSSKATVPTDTSAYDAPTYFAPAYFYGPWSSTSFINVVPDASPVLTDAYQDPYSALLALLQATGAFEDVIFGASTQRSQAGADTYPLAVLTPRGWEDSDDYDPTSIVRRATFSITVVAKGEDDLPPFKQLDRLSTAIKGAVDGSGLGGTCLPALTRISSGHYEYSNHYPEQTVELQGEFSSIIDNSAIAPALS